MNLFNRRNPKVAKPAWVKARNRNIIKQRVEQAAEKIERENPQYAGLIREARKRKKLPEAIRAISSGKLKVKTVKPEAYFYHGALPEKKGELKKGLEARGIKEYKKRGGYNPEENAAIYTFGEIPKEYLYKGRVFSKEFENNLAQVETAKTPQEQAISYPKEKLDRVNRDRANKGLQLKNLEEYAPSLIMGNAKELKKRGIGFALDPEIKGTRGSAKSYILVNMKTGKPISKLDPKLMRIITPNKKQVMRKAEGIARSKKMERVSYEESAEKHFMTREEYEKYMKEKEWVGRENLKDMEFAKELKKQFRREVDKTAAEDVVNSESEKALRRLVDKKTLKKILEEK